MYSTMYNSTAISSIDISSIFSYSIQEIIFIGLIVGIIYTIFFSGGIFKRRMRRIQPILIAIGIGFILYFLGGGLSMSQRNTQDNEVTTQIVQPIQQSYVNYNNTLVNNSYIITNTTTGDIFRDDLNLGGV